MKTSAIPIIISSLLVLLTNLGRAYEIAAPQTSSKECTPVDLRAALGPNRNQGDIGWCYANAAADLLTYKYRELLNGEQASATYLALAYNKFFFLYPDSEGGQISLALWPAQHSGFCKQSVEEMVLRSGPQIPFTKKLEGLLYIKQHFDNTDGASLEYDLQKYYSNTDSVLVRMPQKHLREILSRSTQKNFVKNFADYLCGGKIVRPQKVSIPHFDIKYWYFGQTYPLMKKIHRELSRKNVVAIGYYASFLHQDGAAKDPNSSHASVAVGRRWNKAKNTCEILIRNSWGTTCNGYGAKSLAEPGACDHGNVWVNENVLKEYLTDIEFFR